MSGGGRYLLIEPYFDGSHRRFARQLAAESRLPVDLVTLPGRHWKWRMRAAALAVARQVACPQRYRALMAGSLMSLADLKAIWGRRCPPSLLYFHETQITYPQQAPQHRDLHFAFTDLTSALAADQVAFNSADHRRRFLAATAELIARMPDHRPGWAVDAVAAKSRVVYPGVAMGPLVRDDLPPASPPVLVWNHRWEHDKGPEVFYQALCHLERRQVAFSLVLLGQRFARMPAAYGAIVRRFGPRILFDGRADEAAYRQWLARADVVVSCARQENFGLAVVEAVAAGCWPALPLRLSYPELIPAPFHPTVFYRTDRQLGAHLARLLPRLSSLARARRKLAAAMRRFGWRRRVGAFDRILEELAASRSGCV